MPITIVNMKPLESIDPSSVEAERDKDAELAKKQLLEDYPTLRFGQPPADSDTAIPTTPVEPTAPNTFTMRKFAREEPDAPPPEEKGFFSSLGKTVAAKAKQYAADVPLIVHEERQFQNELEASRASVLPGVVTQARMEGKNILDMPQVKAEAQKLGMRPDMYVRGVEKYVNKTDEELQKIADEARKTAEEQKAKAAPLLKRSKDLAGEIMAARPDYAQWSAQGIAFDALSSMPELAATMAAGFVNPAAGVSTMFGLMMPRYYSEARQEGLSRSQAQTYGMLMAAGEAIPETAVIGRMTSVSIRKALKDGMLKTAGKEFVGTGISEGVSEMITEVYQKGVKSGLYNEETTLKQVLEDTAYAGVVGFAMGGPLGAVSGAAQGRRQQPPPTLSTPPGQTTPAGQITPPPAGGGGAPTAGSTPARTPPAGPAAPAAPAAAQGGPALKAGEPAIYKPTSSPGVAVMVTEVNPQTGEVKAVRLDEQGEPMVDDEGQPMLFVASVNEFPAQIEQPAPSPVAPAAPAGGPPPSTVPPAATSTEPTVDIAGQLKDMWNAKTKRRGVYLSPATVAKMQREGTYEVAKAKGQVEENFDGQGGTLIVKSKKDLDEAKAARDGGQTDMQAIVGGLTGAGVAKPNVAKPAVVQRKDETGAVVQQTAVPQEQAAATAAAVAQQPGTVEVVTPEQALAERNAKVQAEIEEPFKLTTPSPVLEEAAKAATFVTRQFDIPAEGKLTKPDVRSIASFIMTAGTTLKAAAVDAKSRGAPDELIAAANKAARGVEKFDRKSENDFFKARGVSESILRTRAQAVSDALQALVDWHNANPTATKAAPAATPKAPKAEKAKQMSKAKEAPAREERRSDETGPRKEVWTAEERKARREAAERASVEKMGTTEKVEAIMRSKVTGLPNRAALEESEKQSSSSAWASVDADSLAYINDNLGHAAGDLYLKRIANVLKRLPGVEAYHVSGDEFIVTADDIMTLKDSVASANELMARAGPVVFEDGSSVTPTISFGTGKTEKLADLDLIKNKQLRRAKGAIAERKQPPPSFRTAERNKQPAEKVVSATGVQVAPAGETTRISRKKTKYIPPKKRIEQEAEAIEKQVDKAAAPPPVEVLPLAASRVGAADVPLIASELIGLTPAELVNEVEADRSGQLMGVLGTLLEGVQKRNNWMGWYTAVMRGDVMQAQKNTLKGLMRQYIAAEDSEIPGLWEEMLGLMTNVDGKMLPPDAISAIREAANVARAYNEVVTTLREGEWTEEDPESDFREVQSEEVMFDRGILSKDQPGGPGMGTIAEGEGGSTAAKKRKPLLNVARQLLESARGGPLFVGLRDLASEVRADVRLSNLVVESMTGKRVVSSREFGAIITEVAQKSGSSNVRLVGSLLERIIRFAPNVPLEFVRPGGTMLSVRGKPIRNAAGSYSAEGILKIRLSRAPDSRAPVTVDINMLQTFVHEYVHAATVYELRAHPDGPLAKRLTEIREDLLKQAERKFGAQKVRDVMDWYSRAGSSTAPAPAEESTIGQFIYALTNNDELVAESFSSPEFHEFVKGLSATPRWYYQNKFIAPIARALSKLFGRPTQVGQFGKVLSELLRTTDRVMQAQYARQARISRKANDIQSILETRLGFDPATASDLTRSMLSVHNRENVVQHFENAQIAAGGTGDIMPSDVILDAWGDTRLVRGDPRDKEQLMYDRYAFRAYNRTPEELMRTVDHMRNVDPGYLDNYYGRPDFQRLSDAATPALAKAAAAMEWLSKTRLVGKTKETIKGLPSLDFVVRRSARFFGSPLDPNNPLNAWKRVRDMRRSYANQLLEMAESTVNAKWMQLSPTESARTGHVLQQSTLWQIDPRLGEKQTRPRYFGKRAWEAKRVELEKLWTEMTPEEQEVYSSVQTYFKQEYARIRRAAVDLAVDMVGSQLSPVQKSMLYGIRNQESVDRLIGSGKLVDIGEGNDRFAKVLKEVIRVSSIQGPYFPLFRQGDYVVEAEGKGILGDEEPILFATKEEAEAAADEVRSMSPKNKAKVIDAGNGFNVSYTVREVSFHESQNEAAAALADLKARGLAPKDGVYSRKLSDIGAASMTESLKELQSHAQKLAESNKDNAAAQVVAQTIEQAFLELLAQKAASASQQLKRQGVAGFKPAEAHQTFATRVRGSSWHYANLKTAIAQTKALNRLTTASRDMSMPTPSDITPQQAVIERGRVVNEIRERLRIEAAELDVMDRSAIASGQVLAMLGFANFLATPSYAYINAMQNVNVAMPVITAKYGGKGGKALVRAMGVVIGPTMTKAMRGLVSKPGNVTSYDVYSSIHDALKDHPRYGKYVQGDNSAMQQLVDLGVINASFVQELSAVANNRNRYVARGLEYLRLLPQGMELWNRITTSLAVLDSTNGNVQAAADMVNQVHFDYTLENRPRFFRSIHGFRMPQALTMFKMYSVGMYQLTGSLIVDAVSRRGQSVEDRARAATALAGIIAAHVVSAGVMRGLMVEPLRALVNLFWALRSDDDDEFKDIDTAVQRWAAEVSDNEAVRRGLSKGLWAALGFDLSSRMGLDRMIIFNPPEGISEDKMWKFVGQFGGPIPAMIIQKAAKSNEYWNQGKPFEAITELIPLRILQDVRKAWKIVNEGITTKAGATILPAEDFGWVDALGTAAGFRTTEAAKVSDMASTEFSYKGWKKKRVGILVGAYTRAYRDNDQKALDKAMADIMRFNELNPNDPITGRSIAQSWRSQETAVLDRQGEGRNQALQELMDY